RGALWSAHPDALKLRPGEHTASVGEGVDQLRPVGERQPRPLPLRPGCRNAAELCTSQEHEPKVSEPAQVEAKVEQRVPESQSLPGFDDDALQSRPRQPEPAPGGICPVE